MSPYEIFPNRRRKFPKGDDRNTLIKFTGETAVLLEMHRIPSAFYRNPFEPEGLPNFPGWMIEDLVKEGKWEELEKLKNAAALETPRVRKRKQP